MSAVADRTVVRGAYFTDTERLLRIVDACEGHVALEDCARPEVMPEWKSVGELEQLVRGGAWRRVLPAV